jgi:thymidylate synthase (FAD)
MDPHAQFEIREYARTIGEEIVAKWVPNVWEAFRDYRLQSFSMSRLETDIVRMLVAGEESNVRGYLEAEKLYRMKDGAVVLSGELKELIGKLARLGLEKRMQSIVDRLP